MRPSNQAWFDMADTELLRDTFQFILNKIEREITQQNTPMRQAISARRRLAIVLYYLSSAVEYRTIANRFGVSISFVSSSIKLVSMAIIQKMKTKFITIPKEDELNAVMRIYKDKW